MSTAFHLLAEFSRAPLFWEEKERKPVDSVAMALDLALQDPTIFAFSLGHSYPCTTLDGLEIQAYKIGASKIYMGEVFPPRFDDLRKMGVGRRLFSRIVADRPQAILFSRLERWVPLHADNRVFDEKGRCVFGRPLPGMAL